MLVGSLSNSDADGGKNVTNLHVYRWKAVILHALHERFSFLFILQPFSPNQRREITGFSPKRSCQFNSKWVSTHFSSQTTWNNREIREQRRQRQPKRHLKINIWEMVTDLWLLLLPLCLYCWPRTLQMQNGNTGLSKFLWMPSIQSTGAAQILTWFLFLDSYN